MPASRTDDLASRLLSAVVRRPRAVLAVAAVVLVAGIVLASHLQLRTAISELLPSDDPGVLALQKTQKRMGDMSLLLIGIHSSDKDANLRYAEALTRRLRALPPEVCQLATYDVRDIRDFFESHKWLYLGETDLEDIRDRLRHEITRRKNPLLVDLGGDEESLDDLRKRVTSRDSLSGKFPDGTFANDDGRYLWVAAMPRGGLFAEGAGESLWNAARQLVKETPPDRARPDMTVQIGGPIATAIATRQAVERDILWVTLTCSVIVALSIAIYFRRLRAIPLIGIPAVIGTVLAFAVAYLAFGYLNSSTAFLGSIILGNGINYGIILMSRYEEQRAHGDAPSTALTRAVAGVWRGTGVAALSASAAYASLMVTSFRGFYQFGVMGAAGSLLCWLATFTILPAMFTLLDRGRPDGSRGHAPIGLGPLGRLIGRRPGMLLGIGAAITLVASLGLSHFLHDPFEYDFRKLNAKIATTVEAEQFTRKMDDLFGRWPSPTIILADTLDEVELLRAAIRRNDSGEGKKVIGQIATIFDLLPGTTIVQRRKLDLIAEIRRLTHDPALEVLNDDERKQLARIDPPEELAVLGPQDLPPLARRPFTEADGTVGRVALVYPTEGRGLSIWNGRDLLRIASVLQRLELPSGKVMETSGSAVVFGSMIRSILHDGPIATVASLVGVILIIGFIMRPARAALLTLGTLLVGVVWMVGAAGWAGVHVTFLNFIALPITFGIGAEYALNVVARQQQDGDIEHVVASTGGAVALCSWTTIVGYGSLLAARNRALQGFGTMAILGEIACLLAALVGLPSLLLFFRRRRASASA